MLLQHIMMEMFDAADQENDKILMVVGREKVINKPTKLHSLKNLCHLVDNR